MVMERKILENAHAKAVESHYSVHTLSLIVLMCHVMLIQL